MIQRQIRYATRRIAEEPANSELYFRRGVLYERASRPNEAIRDYSTALNLNAGDLRSRRNRAWLYLLLGYYDLAKADFDVLLVYKKDYRLLLGRSRVWRGLGKLELRLKDIRSAIRICPSRAICHYEYSLASIDDSQFQVAVEAASNAITIEDKALYRYTRAFAHCCMGSYDAARPDLIICEESKQPQSQYSWLSGVTSFCLENYSAAARSFCRVIENPLSRYYAESVLWLHCCMKKMTCICERTKLEKLVGDLAFADPKHGSVEYWQTLVAKAYLDEISMNKAIELLKNMDPADSDTSNAMALYFLAIYSDADDNDLPNSLLKQCEPAAVDAVYRPLLSRLVGEM